MRLALLAARRQLLLARLGARLCLGQVLSEAAPALLGDGLREMMSCGLSIQQARGHTNHMASQ